MDLEIVVYSLGTVAVAQSVALGIFAYGAVKKENILTKQPHVATTAARSAAMKAHWEKRREKKKAGGQRGYQPAITEELREHQPME